MSDYRDPKVTNASGTTKGGAGKWIGIAVVVILALLILGWIFGWFADEATEVETTDTVTTEEAEIVDEPAVADEPVVVEEPVEVEPAQ
ncbi:hypothetical protein [Paracoccus beibuensis]|uniref:hypothetical protein n=1 Tax=Paracoccus beibuensis TaxID=547602 RepID=UPI00223FB6F2|nr:hypothetical protein [Paracoccus beibuensis]